MRTIIVCVFLFISKTLFADPCAFCNPKILETQVAFESDYFRVLVDYEPRIKGHLLVVSKRHLVKAHEMSTEEWKDLSIVIPKVAGVFLTHLGTDDYLILEKNGRKAFQDVPHVHFHLLPVTSQKWIQIFNVISPKQLTNKELEKEVRLFRDYFSKE